MNRKGVLVALAILLLILSVILSGCTQTDNSINNEKEEVIDVKILNVDTRTENGSDSDHFNEYIDMTVYNEGDKAEYATIHASLTQQTGNDTGKEWKQEQIVHLDAKESKELTFVFTDLVLGESYQPSYWVEYD